MPNTLPDSEHVVQLVELALNDRSVGDALLDGSATKVLLEQHHLEIDSAGISFTIAILAAVEKCWSVRETAVPVNVQEDADERRIRLDLREGLIKGMLSVVGGIDKGYVHVMRMYNIVFYLGAAFLVTSVIASLMLHEDASAYLFGGIGFAGIVGTLMFRPIQNLQQSRSKLAQLQAMFIGWLNDNYNWNRYWQVVMNARPADGAQQPDFEVISRISEVQLKHTEEMMALIQKYAENVLGTRRQRSGG
ncbi:MAG TPA: hypothetical protein VHI13_02640 [Candidatus Kapabacteria bacterium]|nr:hypothetical protein [Candidatus Kapabacteria bacterium]